MLKRRDFAKLGLAAAGTLAAPGLLSAQSRGEEISVTHWGALMYGTPYAAAMERGLFRQAGINITGILTSKGGGTTVRNVLAGGLPYGEVSLAAALSAMREGLDIKIVNAGVRSVADTLWVTMPNSDIKSIQDLRGKKMAITSPKSVTDMLSIMALDASKVPLAEVERPALGSIGAGLTALESGAVHAASILDPIWSARQERYRPVFFTKDILPPMTQTVGIATGDFIRREPGKLRAIIAGRRAGVDWLKQNADEGGRILSRAYDNLPEAVAVRAVRNMVGIDYWSRGNFEIDAMTRFSKGLEIVGELQGEPNWTQAIDRQFLPDDLRAAT
jgi:NitT/TauT family transport system substrate-binding protein